MRFVGTIAVRVGLLCAATAAAQRSTVTLTEAERAIRTEKGAVLRAALLRESPIEPRPYGRWLSAETTESLTRRYRTETSPTVRAFIVAVLGASAKQNPAAVSTLRDATRDEPRRSGRWHSEP